MRLTRNLIWALLLIPILFWAAEYFDLVAFGRQGTGYFLAFALGAIALIVIGVVLRT